MYLNKSKVLIKGGNYKMNWNKVDLQVKQIYGKLDLEFTPIFNEIVKEFKNSDYKRILDLGCGYGKHSIYLSQNDFNVTSIDINIQAIEWLEKYIDANQTSNINVIKTNINNLPFENDYFDGIICSSVIHHQGLKEIKNSIAEMHRVLKPNGYISINFMSIDDDSFGLGKEIEKNTFVGSREGEENIPHYYTDIDELKGLFKRFMKIEVFKNEYRFSINSKNTITSRMLDVVGHK